MRLSITEERLKDDVKSVYIKNFEELQHSIAKSTKTSKKSIRNQKDTGNYVYANKFGNHEIDTDEEEELDELVPDLKLLSPTTKRHIIGIAKKEAIKKLTPMQTYLSLIKGFIGTLILYLP